MKANTGLDPELLAVSDGYVVPAAFFLPPPEVDEDGIMNDLSYDNAAAEMRPREDHSSLMVTMRLKYLMSSLMFELQLAKDFRQIPSNTELTLSPAAMLTLEESEIESVSTFGCSPSYTLDANYGRSVVTGLCKPNDTRFRSAGFHIHQELPHPGTSEATVAVLDGLLGLTDVLVNEMLGYTDAARKRRMVIGYGRAGEHRVRESNTGVTILEYRALSPWPMRTPSTAEWTMRVTRKVAQQESQILMGILGSYPDRSEIIEAINQSNVEAAEDLLRACAEAFNSYTGGLNALRKQFRDIVSVRPISESTSLHAEWVGSAAQRGPNTGRA